MDKHMEHIGTYEASGLTQVSKSQDIGAIVCVFWWAVILSATTCHDLKNSHHPTVAAPFWGDGRPVLQLHFSERSGSSLQRLFLAPFQKSAVNPGWLVVEAPSI